MQGSTHMLTREAIFYTMNIESSPTPLHQQQRKQLIYRTMAMYQAVFSVFQLTGLCWAPPTWVRYWGSNSEPRAAACLWWGCYSHSVATKRLSPHEFKLLAYYLVTVRNFWRALWPQSWCWVRSILLSIGRTIKVWDSPVQLHLGYVDYVTE